MVLEPHLIPFYMKCVFVQNLALPKALRSRIGPILYHIRGSIAEIIS